MPIAPYVSAQILTDPETLAVKSGTVTLPSGLTHAYLFVTTLEVQSAASTCTATCAGNAMSHVTNSPNFGGSRTLAVLRRAAPASGSTTFTITMDTAANYLAWVIGFYDLQSATPDDGGTFAIADFTDATGGLGNFQSWLTNGSGNIGALSGSSGDVGLIYYHTLAADHVLSLGSGETSVIADTDVGTCHVIAGSKAQTGSSVNFQIDNNGGSGNGHFLSTVTINLNVESGISPGVGAATLTGYTPSVTLQTAVRFVNAGAEGSAGSGNITLGAPASPATNDIWIAVVHSTDNVAHTLTDWSQITQFNGGGATSRLSVWYFRYAGSTPNLVVGHTSGDTTVGGIAAFRDCRTTGSPVNLKGTDSTGTGTETATGITPTVPMCMIIGCFGRGDDDSYADITGYGVAFEDTAGGTQRNYGSSTGTDGSVGLYWKQQGAIAATGNLTATTAATDPWAAVVIALEPLTSAAMTPNTGASTATGLAPTVTQQMTCAPTVGAVVLTGLAPTVSVGAPALTPSVGAVVVTGLAPTVQLDLVLTPVVGAATATGLAPTVTVTEPAITPSVGTVVVTGVAPTVSLNFVLTPVVGAVTATGAAPTVTQQMTREPGTGAVTGTGTVGIVTTQQGVVPSVGTVTLAGFAPGVAVQDATTRMPATGAVVLTGQFPSVTQEMVVTPDTGNYAWLGLAASLTLAVLTTPSTGLAAVTGYAPTVAVEAPAVGPHPDTGTVGLTGYAPTLALDYVITPDTGAVGVQGYASVVAGGEGFLLEAQYIYVIVTPPTTPFNRYELWARLEHTNRTIARLPLEVVTTLNDGSVILQAPASWEVKTINFGNDTPDVLDALPVTWMYTDYDLP